MIDLGAAHFLMVDDESFIRTSVKLMLRPLGRPRVTMAEGGEEALQIMRSDPPDLVICDIEMAPMDGLALLRVARADQDSKVSGASFIMLTAHAEAEKVAAAAELGIDGYLLKPISPKQLVQRVAASPRFRRS